MLSKVWLLEASTTIIAHVFLAAVERSGIKPEDVEEVFFGNVLSAKYYRL
jgi:acetyl-CoA C-acetyltransferase